MTLQEIQKKILDLAKAEAKAGIVESPAGSNKVKYNKWLYNVDVQDGYNLKGEKDPNAKWPWCGAFVSWVFYLAGFPLGTIDYLKGFAGCPYAVKNVAKWGRIVTVPRPTDVVFYDWNGDGKFDHTSIFEQDLGNGLFRAIEGNTAFGNDSNGGKVMERSDRKYKQAIFVRPNVLDKLV